MTGLDASGNTVGPNGIDVITSVSSPSFFLNKSVILVSNSKLAYHNGASGYIAGHRYHALM